MIRVLHIVGDSKFGGGSVIIARLAELAKSAGWQVDVLTTDPKFQEVLRGSGVGVVHLDVIWRDIRPFRDLRGLWRLYRFLRRARYTVVHTHTSKAGVVGRLAAWLARTPVIVHTAHGFAFHEASNPLALRSYAFLEKLAAHWCDRVVTVSEFHRDWGLRLGIGDPGKMVAIPNGIAEARVAGSADPRGLRARLDTAPDELVLLSTGRLAVGKGLEDLLEIVPALSLRLAGPFKLWLAGDGPLRAALEARVTDLRLGGTVRFLGFRRDIGDLLAASDIVVLPTMREGLSIALLEAMAAGKPIVTTTIGSNREAVRGGQAALLVPPGDRGALLDAIARLATQPELGRALGRKARDIFLASYTEQHMLARYRQEYEHLLAERERPAMSRRQAAAKRALDAIVSGAALLALAPVMLLSALAVRLTSPGPALFRQARLGRHGVPFTICKFRTMFVNAPDLRNADGSTYNAADDPRVTPLGRLLRATSLDELPQLINVFKGDMSLVGPRPDQPDQLRFYTPEEREKLRVKPGITGLAQLNGRNSIPWEQRKRLDIAYVRRQSLLLDLGILLKTVPYVLKRRDLYVVNTRAESGDPRAQGWGELGN